MDISMDISMDIYIHGKPVPKNQTRDLMFEAPYLRNGGTWTHGHYGPPIGTRHSGVEWSRDQKGQTRDPIIFEAPYLHNGAR